LANAKALLSAEKKVKTLTGFSGQGGGLASGLSSGDQNGSTSQLSGDAGSFGAVQAEAGMAQSESVDAGVVSAGSGSSDRSGLADGSDSADDLDSAASGESTSLGSESQAELHADSQGFDHADTGQESPASSQESAEALQKPSLDQFQDLKPIDTNSEGADQANTAAMANEAKVSASIGQDAAGQMKDKTGNLQGDEAKAHSLAGTDELPKNPSLDPQERRMPVTTTGALNPTAVSGPTALLAEMSTASSLSATPTHTGDGLALPQADLQATPGSESGAAEGPIQGQVSAIPLAPDQAMEASSVDSSLWSRLVAWCVTNFKR
jgi:hypothetical protein